MDKESEPRKEDLPRPRAAPRYKRKVKMQGVQNLNLESLLAAGDQEVSHQNDILFNVCSRGSLKSGDVVKGEKIVNSNYLKNPSSLPTRRIIPLSQ